MVSPDTPGRITPIPSAPALWALVPFAAGLAVARYLDWHIPWFPLLSGTLLVGTGIWARNKDFRRTLIIASLLIGLFLLGIARQSASITRRPAPLQQQMASPAREIEASMQILHLYRPGKPGPAMGLGRLTQTDSHLEHLQGTRVFFNLWLDPPVNPLVTTAEVRFKGVMQPVSEQASRRDFDAYLIRKGVFFRIDDGAVDTIVQPAGLFQRWCSARNRSFLESLNAAPSQFSRPVAVWKAMMLGETQFLSATMKDQFRRTGTMHLFAISGLHIGIIATLLAGIMRFCNVPLPMTPVLGLPLLYLFVQITGNSPSAVRALIMIAFYWGAYLIERKPVPLAAWAASALFVLLIQPAQLINPGFQLSYAVVGMILIYGLPLADYLSHRLKPFRAFPPTLLGPARYRLQRMGIRTWESFAISLSAFLISQPITTYYFGIFSPISVVLNLFFVFLALPIITLGMMTIIGGILLPVTWLSPFQWVACILLEVVLALVQIALKIPGGSMPVELSRPWMVIPTTCTLLLLSTLIRLNRTAPCRVIYLLLPPLAFCTLLFTMVI